uniref:Uncharacterized protein n=1 Tax=Arion vulgaris TaxID=1028688 RepID=A0A0B7ARA6_9EUPU
MCVCKYCMQREEIDVSRDKKFSKKRKLYGATNKNGKIEVIWTYIKDTKGWRKPSWNEISQK